MISDHVRSVLLLPAKKKPPKHKKGESAVTPQQKRDNQRAAQARAGKKIAKVTSVKPPAGGNPNRPNAINHKSGVWTPRP